MGIYYTPDDYCDAIAAWAIRSTRDKVLEPSFGGGGFLRASYNQLASLGKRKPQNLLWGYDIDPQAHSILSKKDYCLPENLFCKDFLLSTPDEIEGKVDVVIGNPPYIGWKSLKEEQKHTAKCLCSAEYSPSRQANLWLFICLKSLQFLKHGGRFAMVLPRSLIFSDYGRSFLNYFKGKFERVSIIESSETCFKYCGASERPIILLGDNYLNSSSPQIARFRISKAAEIAHITHGNSKPCRQVRQLKKAAHLFSDAKQLGEFFDVKIGIVTGDNEFFLFSEKKLKAEKIQRRWMLPIIAKGRDMSRLMYSQTDINLSDGRNVYMLDTRGAENSSPVKAYLDTYLDSTKENNTTFRKAQIWHQPSIGDSPSAFFSYMTNTGPRLVVNNVNAQCVNSIHRLYQRKKNPKELKWCALYTFSVFGRLASELVGRTYASGLLKLEPSDVKKFPIFVPDSSEMKSERFKSAWEKINKALNDGRDKFAYQTCNDYIHAVLTEMKLCEVPVTQLSELSNSLRDLRNLRD